MAELKIQIVRATELSFPGWGIAEFRDADGTLHTLEDKLPVLSAEVLDHESSFPRASIIQCEVLQNLGERLRIRVCWVETTTGKNSFEVSADQVQWKGYLFEDVGRAYVLRLESPEGTNTLSRARVSAFTSVVRTRRPIKPLILTGNNRYFSAGADLREVAALTPASAYEFAAMGQALMDAISSYPAPTIAAVSGFCMGGGLDLALACTHRIAAPHSIFGHRGASLGIITGWGGTQRLPELIGKARAIQMFVCAEKVHAELALSIHLIDEIAADPVAAALARCDRFHS